MSGPIYRLSLFYKDAMSFYGNAIDGEMTQQTKKFTLEVLLRHLVALVVLWTAICHIPKSSSRTEFPTRFRLDTNNIESH